MIEKYFQTGVRFKWTCPAADPGVTKDGSIIDSPRRTSSMIYDGLDGELIHTGVSNVTTMGFTKGMSIPHTWLVYSYGHTTRCLLAGGDVLTGFMSGCLITQWSENGMRYVGHVGTVESSEEVNRRVKQTFASRMPSQTRGFNPANAWDFNEISSKMRVFKKGAQPRIIALVTTSGTFYSILMFQLNPSTEWCVGGIKEVQAMNYHALQTALGGAVMGAHRR